MTTPKRRIEIVYTTPQSEQTRRAIEGIGQAGERTRRKLEAGTTASGRAANQNARLAESFRNAARGAAVLEGPLGGTAGRLSAMSGALSLMNPLVAGVTVGLAALTAGMTAAVGKTSQWEQSTFKIAALLKTTGGASGRTAGQIEALSQQIGKATLASTNGVREASAQLLTFKSISGTVFDDTLRLAQDLAALGFGSITSATQTLAKALEDPAEGLTRLRRIGVSFTDQQREMIKAMVEAGNQAGAQRAILKVLEDQVGGAGKAEAGGLAGAFDTLTENLGLFLERVGRDTGLVDTLTSALQGLAGSVEALDKATGGASLQDDLSAKIERLNALRQTPSQPRYNQYGVRTGPASFRPSPTKQDLLGDEADVLERQIDVLLAVSDAEVMLTNTVARRAEAQQQAAADLVASERQSSVDGYIASLERETELLRLNKVERDQVIAADRAEAEARREIKGITEAQIASIRDRAAAETAAQQVVEASRKQDKQAAKDAAANAREQEKLARQYADHVEELTRLVPLNARYAEVLRGQGAEAAAKFKLEQKLLNQALAAGKTDSAALRDDIARLADAYVNSETAVSRAKSSLDGMADAVLREVGALAGRNEVNRLNVQLRGADAEATLTLTGRIIDLEEAQAIANLELARERALLKALPEDIDDLNRAYDRLRIETEETFDDRRIRAFAEANRQAAREFEDAWSNSIDYIDGLFGGLLDGLTDRFGKFGGLINAIGADIARGLLPKGANGQSVSIGGVIAGGARDVFGSGSGGGISFNPLGILTNLATGIESTVNSAVGVFHGIDTALGIGNAALPSAPIIPGGASVPLAGAVAPASLAFAPFLGMGAAAILMNLQKLGNDGPAFGARLGINASGTLDIADVGTDDGFDDGRAQALAEGIQALSNAFLEANSLTLSGNAFRGELAFNARRFKASADMPSNASRGSDQPDVTGIVGLNLDSRQFDNANQAMADYIARNLFVAIREGTLEGITTNQADVFQVGVGNMIRRVRDDVSGAEGGLDQFTSDLEFLSTFARVRESLDSVAISADDAAGRLSAAAKSQDTFNKALETIRQDAKAAAAETGSALAGLGDFIDNAHRLFDPAGGDETQIRLRLRNGVDAARSEGGLNGGLDVIHAGVIDRFFDDQPGLVGPATSFDATGAAKRDQIDRPNGGSRFYGNGGAFFDRFRAFGVQFTNTGGQATPFGEHGQPNLFEGGNAGVRFNQPGTGGGYNLTIDARELVKTLTGSEDLDFGEAILDPLFAKGTELIIDSFRVAQGRVDEFFNGITGDTTLDGPLALFEELVPAVSPLVTTFETLRAQIEATRPDLEALNEDFRKFGVSIIDVDQKIGDAVAAVQHSAQDQFLAGLGIVVDQKGQVQAGVDIVGINALAQSIKDIETNAATLFANDDRGVMDQLQSAIQDQLLAGIETLVGGAENRQATIDLIRQVFGDKVGDVDFTTIVGTAGDALAAFAEGIQAATGVVENQIRAQEQQVDGLARIVETIGSARDSLALNPNLSTLSPIERLARARERFDTTANLALAGDVDAQQNIGSIAQDYLEIARDVHASTSEYAGIFQSVDGVLGRVLSEAESELSVARRQLDVLEEIRDGLGGSSSSPDDGRFPVRAQILRALTGFDQDYGDGRFQAFLHSGRFNQALIDQVNQIATTVNFAKGGVMTSHGALDLHRYASGGIATSPQLALFGEGRMPEAYVPLPDGRSIPVTVKTASANDQTLPYIRQIATNSDRHTSNLMEMRRQLAALSAENARLARMLERLGATTAGRRAA